MVDNTNLIFSRVERLLGNDVMERLKKKKVILFGVGGVGSWCAECLIRTGITHLTIVDTDVVTISNINRQLMATTKTVGDIKVEALKSRLLEINPSADIVSLYELFCKDNANIFNLESYDYIIDAIDSLKDKAELIIKATQTNAVFFSSMGAALKLDPTRIRVDQFWKVQGDPLAKVLRRRFRRENIYPSKKFLCVFSDELLQNKGDVMENTDDLNPQIIKAQVNGSLAHITAIFGNILAGLVISHITNA